MIVDYQQFVRQENHYWEELTFILDELDENVEKRLNLKEIERLYYLYQRSASALSQLQNLPSAQEVLQPLERLVARVYAEIHGTRHRVRHLSVRQWITHTFPQTFRTHINAFKLAIIVTIAGCIFGAFALMVDSEAKQILLPFSHLQGDPSQRVAHEESSTEDSLRGRKDSFSAYLMTHNIKVSIFSLALGITWGIGTIIMLFYNGIILGSVAFDYIASGEGVFLMGWLLPHGSTEIPAIIIASQAGFVLAGSLIGRRSPYTIKDRLRAVSNDIVTLIAGASILLVWSGIVESFFSQYHEPFIPYTLKILFGVIELACLIAYLGWMGRKEKAP
ncbi:stage II sporulation protein M [bacterium]|nr:stage II sporulation protein M [bacterium]